ncbi:hypothetical protein CXB51_028351 [Gossypium anomalum]|uniref:Integrase catalytic domain-containing protein n=1 Tax=Gossypium anomalum TaxID=47600 RepID=A0A8J5Y712_9ROSI|nr:hypothetical protein CXB51_028351 [Gossypium anomalum]
MDPSVASPTGGATTSFSSSRLVHSFPRHETVKLDETNYVQWQHQVRLIVEGYDLQGFLDGSIPTLPKVVATPEGTLTPNPDAILFQQQDKLLASWLLSTVTSSLLSYFISTKTASDIWSAASHLFAASSVEKVSQIRHDLHAVRKGGSTVKEYVSRIKTLCALLEASGSAVSEAEKVEVLLGGLSSDFDSVFMLVSVTSEPLSFQKLVDVLMAFENRQTRAARDVPMVAHVVEAPAAAAEYESRGVRGGRSSTGSRGGRGFRPRVQCQICNRLGHVAQRCYYRFDREFDASFFGRDLLAVGGESRPRAFTPLQRVDGGQWVWQHHSATPAFGSAQPGQQSGGQYVSAGSSAGPYASRVYAPGPYTRPSRPAVDRGAQYGMGPMQYAPRQNFVSRMPEPRGLPVQCHGPISGAQSVPQDSSGSPVVNLVGVPTVPPEAPWRTKPRARVFDVDNSQDIGLPRIPDFHASDFSDTSRYDSSYGSVDPYVPTPVGTTSWYPDSGASHHVCQNATNLDATTPYSGTSELLMGNGVSSKILSVGNMVLSSNSKLLRLTNVLCVPSIRKNLLSVSQFANDNDVFFEFHPSYCVIKDIKTQEILLRGQVRDGLYHFLVASPVSSDPVAVVHNVDVQRSSLITDDFTLWHYRLGHPSTRIVNDVLNKCGIVTNTKTLSNVCIACQKGKSHKLPFSRSSTEYVELFELVVSDLWGPASIDCAGNLYYVSFVDMYSRFTWKLVATQFGKQIKKFQSDWGGEFRAFASVLADQGILHRLSCPHTSEQNGVAERKHRHIVETGLTLLAQANLPMKYWGYAFSSAVHLINRLPTSVLQGQSPYQKLYRCAPQYDHLRIFGSQHKGYFCLTPEEKVIVSRHVVFDERRFLFLPSVSTSATSSMQTVTYVPLVRSCSSPPPDTLVGSLQVSGVSSPSPVPDVACANVHSDSGSPSTSCSLLAVDLESRAIVVGNEQSNCPPTSVTSEQSTPVPVPCVPSGNTHTMVTRSKAGIFKPKVLTAVAVDFEPCSIDEALAHPDWKVAVQAEFDALMANSTWDLVPSPLGRRAIGCKWLFKIKRNPDGSVNRRKARLVAKGCAQILGCDFTETFSPVVKPATIRVILSIAVAKRWSLRQVDVNNAFLNGDLDNEVFMQQPPGFVQYDSAGQPFVCRLKKALYGLRQAPRAWFDKLKRFLVSIGFVVSKSDASLFIRITSDSILYVLVYVDDIIITGSVSSVIAKFVDQLNTAFALKDMGDLHYFLGIEVTRSSTGCLHLCQKKYIWDLLARSSLSNAKPVHTPMICSSRLSKSDGDLLSDPTEYRSLAGALQYVVLTRLDIAYAVNRICQFMHTPSTIHMVALKRILRYLSGTLDYGIVFRPSSRLSLVGYADANWGLDFDDHRSTSGYCVYFGYTPVSWCSKKQQVVSRSTAEAEYRSLAAATSDVTWLLSLLQELQFSSVDTPTIWCDSSSAVAVAANPVLHSKFKHVELDLFFVREKVAAGTIIVGEVPACDEVADIFTKPLSLASFTRFRQFLRVFPVEKLDACES